MKKILLIGLILLAGLHLQAQKITNGSGQLVTDGSGALLVEPTVLPYPSVLDDGNTLMWFEASSSYITESGGSVSQWDDRSGNGNHLKQSTSDNQPSFSGDSLVFDGTNDYLSTDTATSTTNQPIVIYMVLKHDTATFASPDVLFRSFDTNGSTALIYATQRTVDSLYIMYAGDSEYNNTYDDNEWKLFKMLYNGDNSEFLINGVDGSSVNVGSGAFGSFTLTSYYAGSAFRCANIKFREIIIRDSNDGSSDILTYLNNKYTLY